MSLTPLAPALMAHPQDRPQRLKEGPDLQQACIQETNPLICSGTETIIHLCIFAAE